MYLGRSIILCSSLLLSTLALAGAEVLKITSNKIAAAGSSRIFSENVELTPGKDFKITSDRIKRHGAVSDFAGHVEIVTGDYVIKSPWARVSRANGSTLVQMDEALVSRHAK